MADTDFLFDMTSTDTGETMEVVLKRSPNSTGYKSTRPDGEAVDEDLDKGVAAHTALPTITAMSEQLNSVVGNVSALQAEATAKWVILNNVDNLSRNNALRITALEQLRADVDYIAMMTGVDLNV